MAIEPVPEISAHPDAVEIALWLRLAQTDGVGPDTGRKLLAAFGLPQQIFEASLNALGHVVSERVARGLLAAPNAALEKLTAATLEWLQMPGNHFLTLADARYPKRLLDIADPPLVLYVKGRAELLNAAAIAIVGSRNATAQGVANAERFAETLSQSGWAVVSGLALGIDAAAHEGALRGAGTTIAVIGTGPDIVYPARNRNLAHRIAEGGAIVSEFPLGTPAVAHNFPRRNRIISGLSRGVLVVEAAAQSGSLITARLAGDQGREVFAIPGSIHSPLAKGCHRLIKDGAKLVESAQDILEELGSLPDMPGMFPAHSNLDRAEAIQVDMAGEMAAEMVTAASHEGLLDAMGFDPVLPDELVAHTGLSAAEVATQVLELELAGLVSRLPGGRYQRLV